MKYLVTLIIIIFSNSCIAMFCPNNFSSIEIGNSIEQVVALCGKPDFQNRYKVGPSLPQEWSYFVKMNPGDQANANANAKITIILKDNHVINIDITADIAPTSGTCQAVVPTNKGVEIFQTNCSGPVFQEKHNVTSTALCGGLIQVGDPQETVEVACGKPAFINQSRAAGTEKPAVEMTEFKYGGSTPATLMFENGQLTERKFG